MAEYRRQVLSRVLFHSVELPSTWKLQLVDCWLESCIQELAFELGQAAYERVPAIDDAKSRGLPNPETELYQQLELEWDDICLWGGGPGRPPLWEIDPSETSSMKQFLDGAADEELVDLTATSAEHKAKHLLVCLYYSEVVAKRLQEDEALSAQLGRAAKRLKELLYKPRSSETVYRAYKKGLAAVHSKVLGRAAQQTPKLSLNNAGSQGLFKDLSNKVLAPDSAARLNQQQAYKALTERFAAVNASRPTLELQQQVTQPTYAAYCELRAGVADALLTLDSSAVPVNGAASLQQHYPPRAVPPFAVMSQQIDAWIEGFAAAYELEVDSMGQMKTGVGVVEPTGSGKTPIINLVPYAALSSVAPGQCTSRVLVVTPRVAIRQTVLDSFSKEEGKSNLADVLQVEPRSQLPTAFDFSRFTKKWAPASRADDSASESSSEDESDIEPLDYHTSPDPGTSFRGRSATPGAGNGNLNHGQSACANNSLMGQLASADIVVANVQQLKLLKLETYFPRMYFGLVIIDEGHHAAAHTYRTILEYFAPAAKVLLTATPYRADRQELPMEVLDYNNPTAPDAGAPYDLKLKLRIQQGYCSNMAYAPVPVYSAKLTDRNQSSCVMELMGWEQCEQSSHYRDIQEAARINPAARAATIRHSLRLMEWLQQTSRRTHTILAQAQDKEDAAKLVTEYQDIIRKDFRNSYSVAMTQSDLPEDDQARAQARAKAGKLHVIIHVDQLKEGFDAPAISVIAMFKVFRSMQVFTQVVGRAARRIQGLPVSSPANVAFVVAHPLLGYSRHWSIYTEERQDEEGELASKQCWAAQKDNRGCRYKDTVPILACQYSDAPISWMGYTRLSRVPDLLSLIQYKISDFHYMVPPETLANPSNPPSNVADIAGALAALALS